MLDQKEKIIYSSGRHNDLIEVRDNGSHRSLYFSGDILQSRMNNIDHASLCLSYTMFMAFPLLLQTPDDILIIGVGGGSNIRFLHQYFPQATIDGVDCAEEVLEICTTFFAMPAAPHICLHCAKGDEFLQETKKKYSLIQLDAFDQQGMSVAAYSEHFFSLCSSSLTDVGLLSCNLWSNNRQHLQQTKEAIEKFFPFTIYIPIPERGNIIAVASKTEIDWQQLHPRNSRVVSLTDRMGIDFVEQVKIARRANLPIWRNMGQSLKMMYKTKLSNDAR